MLSGGTGDRGGGAADASTKLDERLDDDKREGSDIGAL